MIRLRDIRNRTFTLTAQRSSDENFYSPRKDIREAILVARSQALLNENWVTNLKIHRKPTAPDRYALAPYITVQILGDGTLKLGCHEFSLRNTRRILRWAGVKP